MSKHLAAYRLEAEQLEAVRKLAARLEVSEAEAVRVMINAYNPCRRCKGTGVEPA